MAAGGPGRAGARALCAIAFLLCLATGSTKLSLELGVPSAVEAGNNAELQCRYQSDEGEAGLVVKWWRSDQRLLLYQRIAGQPPETTHPLIQMKENDTIVLSHLEPRDTGVYECEVSGISEQRKRHHLVVYTPGTGPQLNVSVTPDDDDDDDDDDVLVTCEADDVAPEPDLVLTVDGEVVAINETVTPAGDGVYHVTGSTRLAGLTAEVTVACELFYANENISHPEYKDTLVYTPSGVPAATDPAPAPAPATPDAADTQVRLESNGGSSVLTAAWLLVAATTLALALP